MEALFCGRKDLFEGLFIYDKWDWTKHYPVIRLDFTHLAFKTPAELEESITTFIQSAACKYGVSLLNAPYKMQFEELIRKVSLSTGQQVVVLIDESYKPVTDHLPNIEILTENIRILNDFYQILKSCDDYTEFVFMTGISRFFGDSSFSSFNTPDDITLNWKYGLICGYTQDEMESHFSEYIDLVADYKKIHRDELLNDIRIRYYGYSWDGKTALYNPFSILSFFSNYEFEDNRLYNETPPFLIERLKNRNCIDLVLEPVTICSSEFNSYDPVNINEISLLFQTGCLTVKQKEFLFDSPQYTLGIPNRDVNESILEYLLHAYSNYPLERIHSLVVNLQKQIFDGDVSAMEQSMNALLTDLPCRLQIKNATYYQSMFLLLMRRLGFDIKKETLTNLDRVDAVLRQSGVTIVAEIKYHYRKKPDVLIDEAMRQIHDRRYYETYLDRQVMLIAIAWTGKTLKCKTEISEVMNDRNDEIEESDNEDSSEMFEHFHFNVDKGQSPLRIDKFVTNRIENASRNKIQAAASADCIWVNGEPVKSSYKVKPLDDISIMMPFRRRGIELVAENIPINIVYEDDDVIVVDKEAGMVVHPGHGNYSGTLVNALLYHLEQQGKHAIIEDDETGGLLVHRIDKNTSGLLVVAKNLVANAKLAKQFFYHSTKRKYIALVWGAFDEKEGTIDTYIGRSLQDRMKMVVFKADEAEHAKHAITHYKVVEEFGYVTLIECRLETGRTHQIRVHMEHIGHPLFSDERYGGDRILRGTTFSKYKQFVENCFSILPRQALHAALLGFRHPATGKDMIFESPLPADMTTVIERWRNYIKHRIEI
jgi:23S rRNA pseudouridine1911/1915/1917 synthase